MGPGGGMDIDMGSAAGNPFQMFQQMMRSPMMQSLIPGATPPSSTPSASEWFALVTQREAMFRAHLNKSSIKLSKKLTN